MANKRYTPETIICKLRSAEGLPWPGFYDIGHVSATR